MKNIVMILGSPRKNGNSELLCDAFAKGAQESGHNIEKIRLQEKDIHACAGCYSCRSTGKCFQKDDMAVINQKLVEADIIVLATPVYYYSMSAQLKMMIDRTLPCYQKMTNKKFYFIATAADHKLAMETTIDSMRGFTDVLPNAEVIDVIYGENAWELGEINGTKVMEDAYQIGKQIV